MLIYGGANSYTEGVLHFEFPSTQEDIIIIVQTTYLYRVL